MASKEHPAPKQTAPTPSPAPQQTPPVSYQDWAAI